MLTRLASAQPGVAHDITIVSLLPTKAHMERLGAGGVTVVELRFDKAGGIATGLFKLASLIAESRPISCRAGCIMAISPRSSRSSYRDGADRHVSFGASAARRWIGAATASGCGWW